MANKLDLVENLTMIVQVSRMKYRKTSHVNHTFMHKFFVYVVLKNLVRSYPFSSHVSYELDFQISSPCLGQLNTRAADVISILAPYQYKRRTNQNRANKYSCIQTHTHAIVTQLHKNKVDTNG